MKNFILIAGHEGDNFGNVTKFGVEKNETKRLIDELIISLYQKGLSIYNKNDVFSFKKVISWINSIKNKPTTTIEFHFNYNNNKTISGTEILIPINYNIDELELAKKLSKIIAITIPTKLIENSLCPGIKKSEFSQITKNHLIIEVCHISNELDMFKYRNNFNQLVENLSNYLLKISK